jgi:lipoate-protein ligase A
MAVDEMLLDRATLVVPPGHHVPMVGSSLPQFPPKGGTTSAQACLRFYAWSEPTLSLGYFQTYAERQGHASSLPCAAVRRLTGGGAILHDAELTYSIVLPDTHPLAARRDELYGAVHGALIEALERLGVTARLCTVADKTGADNIEPPREPFLCFQRRSPGDVLIGRTKICGSAQRRRKGAVLQHGSLLWRTSPAAPELPGVEDIVAHPIELQSAADLWLSRLGRRLGFGWQSDDLDERELSQAETLVESRYAREEWIKNRAPAAVPQSRNALTRPMAVDRLE